MRCGKRSPFASSARSQSRRSRDPVATLPRIPPCRPVDSQHPELRGPPTQAESSQARPDSEAQAARRRRRVGTLARLLGVGSSEVAGHRLESARAAARAAGAIIVLKGDDTLVAEPEGRVAVSRGGVPALATAGTGDVLSGVIGAMLSKRLDPFTATCAAVLTHAAAGRLAAQELGPEGVIASDVIRRLPAALRDQRP